MTPHDRPAWYSTQAGRTSHRRDWTRILTRHGIKLSKHNQEIARGPTDGLTQNGTPSG
jgi:hypothetical protein